VLEWVKDKASKLFTWAAIIVLCIQSERDLLLGGLVSADVLSGGTTASGQTCCVFGKGRACLLLCVRGSTSLSKVESIGLVYMQLTGLTGLVDRESIVQ